MSETEWKGRNFRTAATLESQMLPDSDVPQLVTYDAIVIKVSYFHTGPTKSLVLLLSNLPHITWISYILENIGACTFLRYSDTPST